jgi:hypothetical protein
MRHVFRIILLAIATTLVGCASTKPINEEERVSSIPWNRPASWEGQGQFGGMMPSGR